VKFEIVGEIDQTETTASVRGVRIRSLLQKMHGRGRCQAQGPGPTMKRSTTKSVLCLDNAGNEASLIVGKVYRALPDLRAGKDTPIRVVDESGEDYLFARGQFAFVDFPQAVRRKLLALQKAG
jgi:hypothetical protein